MNYIIINSDTEKPYLCLTKEDVRFHALEEAAKYKKSVTFSIWRWNIRTKEYEYANNMTVKYEDNIS